MNTQPVVLPDTLHETILDFVRHWTQLLAQERFADATNILQALPDGAARYSIEKLKTAIGMYDKNFRRASPEEREQFRRIVSDPATMDVEGERFDVYKRATGDEVIVEYRLPLDGEWSDLTAIFEAFPIENGYQIGLHDLRVL